MAEKAEIRVLVDKEFLKKLQNRLGGAKSSEVVKQALGVYDWATAEVETGRAVLSTSSTGEDIHRLVSPDFASIKSKK